MKYLSILFSLTLLTSSCNSVNKSEVNLSTETVSAQGIDPNLGPCDVNYKGSNSFTISFYSIGAGINYLATKKIRFNNKSF